jgi:hypothetical protein
MIFNLKNPKIGAVTFARARKIPVQSPWCLYAYHALDEDGGP